MSDAMKQAGALVSIALDTYAQEIAPELPPAKRYAGAMVANALGIAWRRLSNPDPAGALVESLGATSIEALVRSIRSDEMADASDKTLPAKLLDYVEAELAITNPKFLDRRKG